MRPKMHATHFNWLETKHCTDPPFKEPGRPRKIKEHHKANLAAYLDMKKREIPSSLHKRLRFTQRVYKSSKFLIGLKHTELI